MASRICQSECRSRTEKRAAYKCAHICVCIYTSIHARTRSLYLRLSAPRNYQGRPSPRQFVKAVIIPADLWHCIHIGRCLPPDQITSPAALGRPGARSLLGYHRRAPWKPSISSPRYYHRLGFWRPFQIKANQHAIPCIQPAIPGVYTNTVFPSLPRAPLLSPEVQGTGRFVPTCVWPTYYVTHARSSDCNLYDWPSLHRDPSFAIIRKRCSRILLATRREVRRWRKKRTGYLLCIARLDSGEGRGPEKTRKHIPSQVTNDKERNWYRTP